ncbi:MAG: trigger factor, partial [Oscillospiraceae bacterium]
VFKVKLNEVQYKELPVADNDFATEVSEFDTLKELKDSIREKQQKTLDDQADMETENKLVDQIVETIEGEIPEVMYENRMDEMVQDFAFRLEQQGLDLKTYLKYTNMDMTAFRDGFKDQAKKQVEMRLALEAVAKLENIVASEEDVDKEVARLAERYSMEPEEVRKAMPLEEVSKDLAVNKAIDFIKSNAKITDEEAPAEKKEKEEK